jgi:malate dehydrogenase
MKVAIIGGAGCVGSCTAYRLAQDGFVSEIVLVDPRRTVAEAHALDIDQAMVHRAKTRVRAGDIQETRNADAIVIAVGVWGRPNVASRALSLGQNLKLMLELVGPLKALSPSALWMIVTTPVDVLVHLVHRLFAIPRHKIIGINRNDTARLRWAVGDILSVPATDVEAYVLGEHGETQVHVMSGIQVQQKKVSLDAQQKGEVRNRITGFLTHWNTLQSGRTAGWTTAEAIGDIVASMASNDGRMWACSTPLEGEYGLRDVSLGVPMRLGPQGVKEIVQLELDPVEREGLDASARRIDEQIKQGQALLKESAGALGDLLALIGGGKKSGTS